MSLQSVSLLSLQSVSAVHAVLMTGAFRRREKQKKRAKEAATPVGDSTIAYTRVHRIVDILPFN